MTLGQSHHSSISEVTLNDMVKININQLLPKQQSQTVCISLSLKQLTCLVLFAQIHSVPEYDGHFGIDKRAICQLSDRQTNYPALFLIGCCWKWTLRHPQDFWWHNCMGLIAARTAVIWTIAIRFSCIACMEANVQECLFRECQTNTEINSTLLVALFAINTIKCCALFKLYIYMHIYIFGCTGKSNIVPQHRWSNLEGYGYKTTTKHKIYA